MKKQRNASKGTRTNSSIELVDHRRASDVIQGAFVDISLILMLIILTIGLEHTTVGSDIELFGYRWLQRLLVTAPIEVAILDIGDISPHDETIDGKLTPVTPRGELIQILKQVADQGPRAIGFDLNFAPFGNDDFLTPDDPRFFDACLSCRDNIRDRPIPVAIGVNWKDKAESQKRHPEALLGSARYSTLASWIVVPHNRMNMFSNYRDDTFHMDTLSAKLASHVRSLDSLGSLPSWLATVVSDEPYGPFMIDYTPLERLQDGHDYTLVTAAPEVIASKEGNLFRDKLVLIGDATRGIARDSFQLPIDTPDAVPGIYIHACATNTLATTPLYKLTPFGRLLVDLSLSGIVVCLVTGVHWFYRHETSRRVDTLRLRRIAAVLVATIAFVIGVVFVGWTRVLWYDFILVVAALLLHPSVGVWAVGLYRFAARHYRSVVDWLIFEHGEADKP